MCMCSAGTTFFCTKCLPTMKTLAPVIRARLTQLDSGTRLTLHLKSGRARQSLNLSLRREYMPSDFIAHYLFFMPFCSTFNKIYNDDKQSYGDPSNSNHDTVEPASIQEWCKTIDKFAAAVQAGGSGSKKRKRIQL